MNTIELANAVYAAKHLDSPPAVVADLLFFIGEFDRELEATRTCLSKELALLKTAQEELAALKGRQNVTLLEAFDLHARQFTYRNHPAKPEHFPRSFSWFEAGFLAAGAQLVQLSEQQKEQVWEMVRGFQGGIKETIFQAIDDALFLAAGAQAVPEGYQLVPVEPTIQMMSQMPASANAVEWKQYYKAMLAAAPVQAQEQRKPLTDAEIRDLVKECGLDWHRGFYPLFDGDETNRFAVLVQAAEAKLKDQP